MQTQPKTRLPGLDTLRALAIVVVMLFHFRGDEPTRLRAVASFGWMGVDLFFVLSGFLIGRQFLRLLARGERPSLREFYRNRSYRILPAYFVVLAIYLVWPGWHEASGFSPLWEFLTFTENLFVDYSRNYAFSHVWSLCVEEHFYLVFPLAALWLSQKPSARKTVAVLVGMVLFGIAIRSFFLFHTLRPLGPESDSFGMLYIERIYYPTYSRLDGLLAGVALALVHTFRAGWRVQIARYANALAVAGVVIVGVSCWLFTDRFSSDTGAAAMSTIIGFPLLSLGLVMLVSSAAERVSLLGRVRIPGAQTIAVIAFSLYLVHKEVANLNDVYLLPKDTPHTLGTLALHYASSFAVSAVLYLAVERPFLKLRDRGAAS